MYIKKGFTLIELLVVISIIALLISILMPALNMAKMHATGAACLVNLKSLGLAWTMYAHDNDDKLVSGEAWANYNDIEDFDWVHPVISNSHPRYSPTMTDHQREIEGIRDGALYKYTRAVDVYNCPGDKEWKRYEQLNANKSPFRSYAVSVKMNGQWNLDNDKNRYFKLSDIKQPAGKMVFLEEQENEGRNWGSWILPTNPNDHKWWDPIAVWHSKASTNLSFADGHAEQHHWVDKSTIFMADTQTQGVVPATYGEEIDLKYIRSVYHHTYSNNW